MKQLKLDNSSFVAGMWCVKKMHIRSREKDSTFPRTELLDYKKKFCSAIFPGGIDLIGESTINRTLKSRDALMLEKCYIYDATEYVEDIGTASFDIIAKDGNNIDATILISNTEPSEAGFYEACYAYYIFNKQGYKFHSIKLAYVNKEYQYKEVLDSTAWKFLDMTKYVVRFQKRIEKKISFFIKSLNKINGLPNIDIGTYCFKPSPCIYKDLCFKSLPQNNIFECRAMKLTQSLGLYYRGVESMDALTELSDRQIKLKNSQIIQIQAATTKQAVMDIEGIKQWLKKTEKSEALLSLDFETTSFILPVSPKETINKPYSRMPFQYSLHTLNFKTNKEQHFEYLADPNNGLDTLEEFAVSLINAFKLLDKDACIVTYNKSFESGVIKQAIKNFPKLEKPLQDIDKRLIDLMDVFTYRNGKDAPLFYDYRWGKSFSLKNVCSTILNFDYKKELVVNNGQMASEKFYEMLDASEQHRLEIREQLLTYCGYDSKLPLLIIQYLKNLVTNN